MLSFFILTHPPAVEENREALPPIPTGRGDSSSFSVRKYLCTPDAW